MLGANAGCPIQAVLGLEWDNGSRCATSHLSQPLRKKSAEGYRVLRPLAELGS
jgi:hypothetical protein